MDFATTAFGKGHGHRLLNTRIRDRIMNKLEHEYHLSMFKPYGKTYRHVTKEEEMNDILDYEHLINYKIKEPLTYLYLTESFAYYIQSDQNTKTVKITATIQRFDPELFQKDNLFEGYLLDKIFLVEDIVIHNGNIVNLNLEDRIKLINEILDYKHRPDPVLDTHRVILKDYVEYKYLRSFLTDYMLELDYAQYIDGVVFSPLGKCPIHIIMDNNTIIHGSMPEQCAVQSERCDIIENPKKDTACFVVKSTNKPDVYELYLNHEGILKYYDIASVPDRKTSAMLKTAFKHHDKLIMICVRSHIKRWTPDIISNRLQPDSWELLVMY